MKKLIFKSVVALASLFVSLGAMAQNQIYGVVFDPEGLPLPGAGVVIKGTTTGTVTDADGKFTLNAKKGDQIEVSFLGFSTATVDITDAVQYPVTLEGDENFLEETVVVGYGTQKRVNLTGSVSSVNLKELENRPIVSTSSALQGVAAGVTVTSQSGAPGDDGGTIRIRGIGTFGGSSCSPLVLIDGVEGSLDGIDANQIDKISILKDAASSAIYGSRAANGVILVTTKRAEKGKKSVTYRGYAGWQEPTRLPSTVNAEDYMRLSNQENINDGKGIIYSDDYIKNYRANNALDPDTYPITDWQREILLGSGFTQNHNLTFSASSEKVRVNTSIGYLSQKGIIKTTDYYRINVRNNVDVELHKKLHMKVDLALAYSNRNRLKQQNTVFNYMNTRDPLTLTRWSTGNYAALSGGSVNVLALLNGEGGTIKNTGFRANASITLTYDPLDWLTIEGMAAPRFTLSEGHNFEKKVKFYSDPYGTVSPASNCEFSNLTESSNRDLYGNYLLTVNFHKTWKNQHALKVLLGGSYETYDERTLSGYRQDFPYDGYETLNAGGDNEFKSNSNARYQWALLSYFGRINYNFKERYLLEANIRFDGSSRFAKGHQWGIFPSFSAAWRITEEPWMRSIKDILTETKIRASYGQLGNQNIGDSYYPAEQTLNIGSSISVNGTQTPIATLTTLANPDLTWETTEMYDVGLDFTLWNKFNVTADWYLKNTYGILMQLDIPQSIGLGKPFQNAGQVRNMGYEIALGYHDTKGDWNWGVDFNFSDVFNKIIDMKGTTGGGTFIRNQEGSEINSIYGLVCNGIVRSQEEADLINYTLPQYGKTIKPGDLWYKDTNKDGKVDDNDKTIIGGTIPHLTYGITLNIGWKGINLSAFFQGVGKADAMLSSYYIWPGYQGGTYRSEFLNAYNPSNPATWQTAAYPRLTKTDDISYKESTFWMSDASYCRLKNLQLSYTFPKKLMKKAKIQNIMVFANAQNLFTWTKFYQGYDPELAYSGSNDGVTLGAVAYNYPQVRTFTFGLELKF